MEGLVLLKTQRDLSFGKGSEDASLTMTQQHLGFSTMWHFLGQEAQMALDVGNGSVWFYVHTKSLVARQEQ